MHIFTKNFGKSLIIALLHICILSSLGGKLLYDRATRPRVWVKTVPYDPDLPVRGRYLTMQLQVKAPWASGIKQYYSFVALKAVDGELVAERSELDTGNTIYSCSAPTNASVPAGFALLSSPTAYFIPEHADIPVNRKKGEELWAEVTIPRKGPPRPIQLALKKGNEWHPLKLN